MFSGTKIGGGPSSWLTHLGIVLGSKSSGDCEKTGRIKKLESNVQDKRAIIVEE
jgi:hypothetical protein